MSIRSVHDHLQQLLVGAHFSVDGLLVRSRGLPVERDLEALSGLIAESIQVSRSLTAELCPSVLYREGLAAALRWLAGSRCAVPARSISWTKAAPLPESSQRFASIPAPVASPDARPGTEPGCRDNKDFFTSMSRRHQDTIVSLLVSW